MSMYKNLKISLEAIFSLFVFDTVRLNCILENMRGKARLQNSGGLPRNQVITGGRSVFGIDHTLLARIP